MRRIHLLSVLFIVVVVALIWSFGREHGGGLTPEDTQRLAKQLKADMKAEMAAEGKTYEPGAFPTEWAYIQRAYPYDRINSEQLRQAVIDAQAMKLEARKVHAPLGADWVEKGPSNIGARVTDLAMHPVDPEIIYAAHASSGILRSTDGGASWDPITDDLPVISMGAMAVDPTNPDIIYAGTGEANGQAFSWFGMGLYKSMDGGATWEYKGLEDAYTIGRIVIDPLDTDRLWVAGTGRLCGVNPERGVYRSLNAGDTWDHVLFLSDTTAAIDIVIDPARPDTVFAAMWERIRGNSGQGRRWGGLTSGIHRSYDGGDTWVELTNGLPSGSDVGRIGLSLCASNPNVVYAIYHFPNTYEAAIYKTVDGGDTWTLTDTDISDIYSTFGWYFGQTRVDPEDPDRVFAMGVHLYGSDDGGGSWSNVGSQMHVDHHAMAFDPNDHTRIFNGNDGGIYVSTNSGGDWTKLYDQPTNQFYSIAIDYLNPSRLYGGTQDNGTLRSVTGGTNDWEKIMGGDGFYCVIDPTDSDIIFAEYQYGQLYKSVDFADSWGRAMDGIDGDDRHNWMTPVVMDPWDHMTLYYGSQRVYRSSDGAEWWTPISDDLTNGDWEGVLGTITTIDVAVTDTEILYVGTDDGNVWVTQDAGTTWTKVSDTLPNRYVTRVAIDPTDAGTAYVTYSGFRWDENIGYIYRTADYGANWTDITGNLPGAPVNAVAIDPAVPSRLFVGTDVGCYYTESPGTDWMMLGIGLPAVPVYDIRIHGPTRMLVAGTHGRSMHAFDLSTLTDLSSVAEKDRGHVTGLLAHPNPCETTTSVTFELVRPVRVELDIYDIAGRKVRTLSSGNMSSGRHSISWDARDDHGRRVASGVYYMMLETPGGAETASISVLR
jgi:photosystem II stability/assembly factor-like uncharacterized protein